MKYIDYCKPRVNNDFYYEVFKQKFQPLISEILDSNGRVYSEEGCGIGYLSKAIVEKNKWTVIMMSDIDVEMIRLARKNLKDVILPMVVRDSREDHKCDHKKDVIFSSDLLTVLNYEDQQKCLDRQRKIAKKVIHHVSTSSCWYDQTGWYMSADSDYWKKTLKPDRSIKFNDGQELILIWEK